MPSVGGFILELCRQRQVQRLQRKTALAIDDEKTAGAQILAEASGKTYFIRKKIEVGGKAPAVAGRLYQRRRNLDRGILEIAGDIDVHEGVVRFIGQLRKPEPDLPVALALDSFRYQRWHGP